MSCGARASMINNQGYVSPNPANLMPANYDASMGPGTRLKGTADCSDQCSWRGNTTMPKPGSLEAPTMKQCSNTPCVNWDSYTGMMSATSSPDADFYRYAPTKDGVERYIQSAGASRVRLQTRSSLGRITGTPNLLRAPAPVPITSNDITFNDSSIRQNIATSVYCQDASRGQC